MSKAPIVDITTLVGIQSLFEAGITDPWAGGLAGRLADLFIFNETARFILPVSPEFKESGEPPPVPSFFARLMRRDSGVFKEHRYETDAICVLSKDELRDYFEVFYAWAKYQGKELFPWSVLHKKKWITDRHKDWIGKEYLYHVDELAKTTTFEQLSKSTNLSSDEILYAFDVAMRYSLYGEMAGEGAYYLSHPVREGPRFPDQQRGDGPQPSIPVSFSEAVANKTKGLNEDEYTVLLHEFRQFIREEAKIHLLRPSEVKERTITDIAGEFRFPIRIKTPAKVVAVASGILSAIEAILNYGPAVTIPGLLVTASSVVWRRKVPSRLARFEWLRWMLEPGWKYRTAEKKSQ